LLLIVLVSLLGYGISPQLLSYHYAVELTTYFSGDVIIIGHFPN